MIHGIDTTFLIQVESNQHSHHQKARAMLDRLLEQGDQFALAPQVLAEFVHIITDEHRFENPLSMIQAVDRAQVWWNSREVVPVFPDHTSTLQFLAWMSKHRLGRKRILDTQLAAIYHAAGIVSILSTNVRDFRIFGCFEVKSA